MTRSRPSPAAPCIHPRAVPVRSLGEGGNPPEGKEKCGQGSDASLRAGELGFLFEISSRVGYDILTHMETQRSILFVCTGNVFRSVAAEYCFKKYLSENNIEGWKVGSAGIFAEPASVDPKILETLQEFGIDASEHQQRRLTQAMLTEYDAVVGLAENHIEFMKSEFGYRHALLLNDLALGETTSIWDIENEVPDYHTNRAAVEEKLERTVKEIHSKIPDVYKNTAERFYLLKILQQEERRIVMDIHLSCSTRHCTHCHLCRLISHIKKTLYSCHTKEEICRPARYTRRSARRHFQSSEGSRERTSH